MSRYHYNMKKLQIMLATAGLEVVARLKYAEHRADFEIEPVFAVRGQQNADLISDLAPRRIQSHTFSLKDWHRYHRSCPVV